jgi:plastocyanin
MRHFARYLVPGAVIAAGFAMVATSQAPPAPTVDRVQFPAGYQSWQVLYTLDRPDNPQIVVVYGNDLAASVVRGGEYDYPQGSILVAETWPVMKDAQGNPALDSSGRFAKAGDTYTGGINVMRKGPGLGIDYGVNRNGDWAYGSYHTDGSFQTPPEGSAFCAACHLQVGTGTDFVFRNILHTNGASGAAPNAAILNYTFLQKSGSIEAGQTFTVYNQDAIRHTLTFDDKSVDSGVITPGASYAFSVGSPGVYNYHCSIHPTMKGSITVSAPGAQ